jgi:putative methionine-R-sulfoxide reductase with GAF domain
MKFFRERPLSIQTKFVLSLFAIIIILELAVIRWQVSTLEEVHYQREYARKAQLTSQQVLLRTNLFLQGENDLGPQLLADTEQHDHMMETLQKGGRVDGTAIFISKLDRLSSISLEEVIEHWDIIKLTIRNAVAKRTAGAGFQTLEGRWINLSSWYNRLILDLDVAVRRAQMFLNVTIGVVVLLNVGLLGAVYFLFRKHIIDPLHLLSNNARQQIQTHTSLPVEMSEVADGINEVTEHLKDASQFVQEIGKGNLHIDYKELDGRFVPGKNKLADSLIEMQAKLRQMNEEEQRRQWSNDGLAKFVDILRTGGENIHQLGDKIIAALVAYTRSNQGGLYLLNDDDSNNRFLELISLFAFDIRKFETQKIKPGEGILGQTFLEKETTYLKEMPQEYIRITSGLGGANPKSLLVVPLKIDQTVYGVIELASFNEYLEHEIKFVEKLSETIASTFSSVKSAQRNRALLEESNTVTEMMRAQEEEMRQNMEELQATQEEMGRKERDYIQKIQQLEQRAKEGTSSQQLEKLRTDLTLALEETDALKKELAAERAKKISGSDAWAVAQEVEKALRINLEALKITREELDRGPDS